MREPSKDEVETLERRLAQLETFLGEREPALLGLAELIGLEDPTRILSAPRACLTDADAYVTRRREATDGCDEHDPMWVLTRLGYLVGDALATDLDGEWHVNEAPQSRTFTRYVVGRFSTIASPTAVIDPFEVAHAVLGGPPGSSLARTVDQIEADLRAIGS